MRCGCCSTSTWGQSKAREQLEIFIGAASAWQARSRAAFGPPGLNKNDALTHHCGRTRRQPAPDLGAGARKPKDLAAILTNLERNDVLFIDEIHRLSPVVEKSFAQPWRTTRSTS